MKLDAPWMRDPGTIQVMAVLRDGGHQALFVGGCVRNALLGQPVDDIDIATDARPDRVMDLAQAAGLKAVGTGIDHGTVTVIAGGIPHEITTFRNDIETDGRRAKIAYSDRIEDDAARRDFTMNALYADAGGRILDPVGSGLADLRASRLRFIGQATARIAEDYLRILRYFRFHAWYADPDGGFDPEALAAIAAGLDGLARLPQERIGHEMRRLLAAPDPAPALGGMAQVGVLAAILPGATAAGLAPLIAAEAQAGAAPSWLRRLAVIAAPDATARLRLAREESRRLGILSSAIAAQTGPAELGYRLGVEAATDTLLLRAALQGSPVSDESADEIARGAAAIFPVRAGDLMPGLEGPALGARLKELEQTWIASGFTLDRATLLA